MKVSELWLREWVNPSLTGAQLAAQLTMAGLEVEGLNPVAGAFDHVIVARVQHTTVHPDADKLTLCKVDTGSGVLLDVVCGAANVRPGLTVALALPGAHLPGDIFIKESMLRGQPSQGMLCSSTELGLEDSSEGIMELANDAPLGMDLRDYLSLNDHVLDIDLTPNRADCFSVLGVAREVAVLNQLPLSPLPSKVATPTMDEVLTIDLQAQEACPHYCGRVIRRINPHAVTPLWMQERLRRSGVRAIHPVVDVTNYVMLELGQPMHAFDMQAILGGMVVRYAHADETLVLLNDQTVTLDETVLVIASHEKPLAMAGVMGGVNSAVEAHTTDIFLESAFFNPLIIGGVARRYGLFSDSSQRFERGVDPTLQVRALERATELLEAIVGGQVGPVVVAKKPAYLPKHINLSFHPTQVQQLTGVAVPYDEMLSILTNLGMKVSREQEPWVVDVPAHRFDITLAVDLVEEIIRVHGYDKINALPVMTTMQAGTIHPSEQLINRIATFLSGRGYHEVINYSFVDPALQQAIYPEVETLSLLNPISSELSDMRVGLWPGLLASMLYNVHRQQTVIKFFETGVLFDVQGEERQALAGLLVGEQGALNWSEPVRAFDFYDMKGDLHALFEGLGIQDVSFVADEHSALHPGQSARIMVGEVLLGWMGALHPRLVDALDLSGDIFLFEISLAPLGHKKAVRYCPISKYPQIRRDLSLLVDDVIPAAEILQAVREVVASTWLKAFDIFDVYMGESIPVGKKSLALALTLQDDHRTLVDAEINVIIDAIIKKLGDRFAIILRE